MRTTTAGRPHLRRLLAALGLAVVGAGLAVTPASPATAADAPGTPTGATTTSAAGTWLQESLSSTSDVDVFRFTTSTTRYARVQLGDLGADYALTLLDRTGKAVATSDRSGRAAEEVYRRLTAGTWFVKVTAPHRAHSSRPYAVRFTSLTEGPHVLSRNFVETDDHLEWQAEVLNNTPYDMPAIRLQTLEPGCEKPDAAAGCPLYEWTYQRSVPARSRVSLFYSCRRSECDVLLGPWSVRPSTSTAPLKHAVSMALTKTVRVDSSTRTYSGTYTNTGTRAACWVSAVRSDYDRRDRLVSEWEADYVRVAAGRTVSWRTTAPDAAPGAVRSAWAVTAYRAAADGSCPA